MQHRKLVDLMHNHENRHMGEVEKRGGVIAGKNRLVIDAGRAIAANGFFDQSCASVGVYMLPSRVVVLCLGYSKKICTHDK